MTQAEHQTVRLAKGRHESPEHGACVMELASMLAGDRFTDHPRGVCPVIAGFLRTYNDRLPDGQQDELYAYASLVVGTAARRPVRRRRARRVLAWADGEGEGARPHPRLLVRLQPWDFVLLPAVETALSMDPERRRSAVGALLEELCAMGSAAAPEGEAAAAHTRSALAETPRRGEEPAPAAVLARSAGAGAVAPPWYIPWA